MDIEERVIEVVAEVLETSPEDLSPDLDIVDDLGATSIDVITLAWHVEDIFGLGEIDEATLESIHTISELIAVVEERTGQPIDNGDSADVVVAADHAGVAMKADLIDWVEGRGVDVRDLGPADTKSVDYPDFAARVARQVGTDRVESGILICGSGIGMSIAANKVDGVRAAVVTNPVQARLARRHNNANVLCIGARLTGRDMARECVATFLDTSFEAGDDGRHRRRVRRIHELERATGSN